MTNLLIEASKYLMALFMAWYAYLNFRFFSYKEEKSRKWACAHQTLSMFLIHALAYLIIGQKALDGGKVLAFYLAQVAFFLCYIYLGRWLYPKASRLLTSNMCMLLAVGFIILARISMDRAMRQLVVVVAGAAFTWIIPFLMARVWQLYRIPWVYGGLGIALLAATLAWGTGSYGARLSLSIGELAFQPSEFVKISFVFFIAAMFYRSTGWKTLAAVSAVAAAHVLLLVACVDLGGALIFFITYLSMVFVATSSKAFLLAGLAGGMGASMGAYGAFQHVRDRVGAWLDPWADIDNKGYQIAQSLFAMGTGGWFGMGLCQGMPYRIPVVEKDFVFAAISEELGGVFAICLAFICLGCFIQFILVARGMQAGFYKLLAFGLGTVYMAQVFLTIGGTVKFIPLTGVTLPLVSYGGSSMVSTFLMFSLVQGLFVLKENEKEAYEES